MTKSSRKMSSAKRRKAKRFDLRLMVLDPRHFTDLAAVRAFAWGNGAAAMRCAIEEALTPFGDSAEASMRLPESVLADCRLTAANLVRDLGELTEAAFLGAGPVLSEPVPESERGELVRQRTALLLLTLASVPDWEDHIRVELLRYLGDESTREAA